MSPRTYASKIGAVKIKHDPRTGTLTYVQRGGHQTAIDRNGVSLDTYIHAIYGLICQSPARRVLMIGCGGGALATMLSRAGRTVEIVDIDKISFTIARNEFQLRSEIPCHVADGLAYLQRTRKRFDAVVVDAFIGEKIPKHLLSDAFCGAVRRVLTADGLMCMNFCLGSRDDLIADNMAARLERNRWRVRILDRVRAPERNAIVVSGAITGLRCPRVLAPPCTSAWLVKYEVEAMRFRRIQR